MMHSVVTDRKKSAGNDRDSMNSTSVSPNGRVNSAGTGGSGAQDKATREDTTGPVPFFHLIVIRDGTYSFLLPVIVLRLILILFPILFYYHLLILTGER